MFMATKTNAFSAIPSFIPGSGIVAGEILESLWSSLNSISPAVRTATLPHRAEMLDDHASDSNHKKMLGMTATLCSKSHEALDVSMQLGKHHEALTAAFGQQATEKWEDEVTAAESDRLTDLNVMDMYATQGLGSNAATAPGAGSGAASASASASASVPASAQSAVKEWVDFAILVEQMQ